MGWWVDGGGWVVGRLLVGGGWEVDGVGEWWVNEGT